MTEVRQPRPDTREKTAAQLHPDYTGHERGAKADRSGQTRAHFFYRKF